jgi:hypothetical protein
MQAGDILKGEISQSLLLFVTHGVIVAEDHVVLKNLYHATYRVYVRRNCFVRPESLSCDLSELLPHLSLY